MSKCNAEQTESKFRSLIFDIEHMKTIYCSEPSHLFMSDYISRYLKDILELLLHDTQKAVPFCESVLVVINNSILFLLTLESSRHL